MRAAYLILLAPLLGGCLGPAPWSDWKGDGTQTQYSSVETTGASEGAPVGDMSFGERSDVETATLAPPPGATSSTAPFVARPAGSAGNDAEEAMTAPPPTNPNSGMGGPYAPLDLHEKAGVASNHSATVTVRTLPLMVTGTGTKTN